MPIVLNQSKVAELKGQYKLEPAKRHLAIAPAPPAAPAPVNEHPAQHIDLAPVVGAIKESQQSHERQMAAMEAMMSKKQGGKWTATVKQRDTKGRILQLEFTEQKAT